MACDGLKPINVASKLQASFFYFSCHFTPLRAISCHFVPRCSRFFIFDLNIPGYLAEKKNARVEFIRRAVADLSER
jgi:putative component of membrane protein insertase Oxa1/YidC/SpoIIIJ protein YidD